MFIPSVCGASRMGGWIELLHLHKKTSQAERGVDVPEQR